MALEAHYILLIVYIAVYIVILFAVGVYVYYARKKYIEQGGFIGDSDGYIPQSYCEQLIYAREIYTAVIVHLYDQATDIAVMYQWYGLLKQEINGQNLEGVDMRSFFIPGLGFILLYRIITVFFALYEDTQYGREKKKIVTGAQQHTDIEKQLQLLAKTIKRKTFCQVCWDLLLSILDFYFIKVVYKQFWDGEYKPNQTHRSLQLCESLFER